MASQKKKEKGGERTTITCSKKKKRKGWVQNIHYRHVIKNNRFLTGGRGKDLQSLFRSEEVGKKKASGRIGVVKRL